MTGAAPNIGMLDLRAACFKASVGRSSRLRHSRSAPLTSPPQSSGGAHGNFRRGHGTPTILRPHRRRLHRQSASAGVGCLRERPLPRRRDFAMLRYAPDLRPTKSSASTIAECRATDARAGGDPLRPPSKESGSAGARSSAPSRSSTFCSPASCCSLYSSLGSEARPTRSSPACFCVLMFILLVMSWIGVVVDSSTKAFLVAFGFLLPDGARHDPHRDRPHLPPVGLAAAAAGHHPCAPPRRPATSSASSSEEAPCIRDWPLLGRRSSLARILVRSPSHPR